TSPDPAPRDGGKAPASAGKRFLPRKAAALSRGPRRARRGRIPRPAGDAGTLDRPLGDGPGPEGSAGGPVRGVTGSGRGTTQDRRPGASDGTLAAARGRPRGGPGVAPRRSGRSGRVGHGPRDGFRVPATHGSGLLLRLL